MELKDYLAVLRRFWLTWVGVTILGVLLAVLVLVRSTPTYEARAQVFVASSSTGTSQMVGQRVKSYPDVAVSRAVLGPVIDRLHLEAGFADVRARLRASNPVDTSQILIIATGSDPEQAAELANAVADEFTGVVEGLESAGAGVSPVNLTVTDPASAPSAPSSPNTTYVLALGVLVGLLLGLALAIVRSRVTRTLYDEADIRAAWGVDERIDVLTAPSGAARRSPLAGRPASALARRLEVMAEDRPVRVLLLSPTPAPVVRPAVLDFAQQVAEELRARGVSAATGEYEPDATTPDADPQSRVRIDVGDPMAPLRVWRRVAQDFAGVVLVVRSGRVAGADLHELRAILRTATIRPLAVVLTPKRRAGWPFGRRSRDSATAPDTLSLPGLLEAAGDGTAVPVRAATPPTAPAAVMGTATAVRTRPLIGSDERRGKPGR